MLIAEELGKLYRACAADKRPVGRRDAALIALRASAGVRHIEATRLQGEDYHEACGRIRIGRGEDGARAVFAQGGGKAALDAWVAARLPATGPLLCRINRCGQPDSRPMSGPALMGRLRYRVEQAGTAPCIPDDLRHTYFNSRPPSTWCRSPTRASRDQTVSA